MALVLSPRTTEAKERSSPLGVRLAKPSTGEARTASFGLRPQDLHAAYELPLDSPTPQTVGIVDAYDDPTIESDLQVYDQEFGLPECTTSNGCFRKLNEDGDSSPLPQADDNWSSEISLDVETVHAVCQNCHIVLVEAESNWDSDFEAAEETAVAAGADEVSNSYGGAGYYGGYAYDHPGVVITASTGDYGYDNWSNDTYGTGANYPAAFPDVVAVGGTELSVFGESWGGETAWDLGGSGCNVADPAPRWQTSLTDWSSVGCGSMRASADIAADADPYTGVAIYDSTPYPPFSPGWLTMGGTSLASPIIAAAFALAGGSHGVEYPAQTLYSSLGTAALHDITSGSNWGCPTGSCSAAEVEANCSREAICNAGPGYDGPTGVGTLDGLSALEPGGAGPAPTVTSVSPGAGSTSGGTELTIHGTGLEDPLHVRFGDVGATILSSSEESVTVRAPAHEPGQVDVTVTDHSGVRSSTSSADRYEYIAPEPHVTSIAPAEGPTAGGTTVTLEGTNLEDVSSVTFGGAYASIIDAKEDELTVITPSHEAGHPELIVEGPYGVAGEVSAGVSYTFVAPPPPPHETLAIDSSGSGTGSVAVSAGPSSSSCRSNCTMTFSPGTRVWIYAYPDAGSTFQGWSGSVCSGTGVCELMLEEDLTVTASFGKFPTTVPTFPPTTTLPGSGTSSPSGSSSREQSGGPEGSSGGTSRPDALRGCLVAAHDTYLRALHRAAGRQGAIKRARRLEKNRVAACRRRFSSSSG